MAKKSGSISFFMAFLFVTGLVVAQGSSPAPSPTADAVSNSPPAPPPQSGSPSPSHAPSDSSPAASPPAPITESPKSEPESSHSPSPAPSGASYVSHGDLKADEHGEDDKSSGMSGRAKAGISIAVILGAGALVIGGLIYKKRKDNMRRNQYGYATREML